MNNNTCPVCGQKTTGKPVREIHFCKDHRDLAIIIRDDPEINQNFKDSPPKGVDFVHLVNSVVRTVNIYAENRGIQIKGTLGVNDNIWEEVLKVIPDDYLEITFRESSAFEIKYVDDLIKEGILSTKSFYDMTGLMAVGLSGSWEGVKRNFTFRVIRWGKEEIALFGKLVGSIETLKIVKGN